MATLALPDGYHLSLSISQSLWADLLGEALPIQVGDGDFDLIDQGRKLLHAAEDQVKGLLTGAAEKIDEARFSSFMTRSPETTTRGSSGESPGCRVGSLDSTAAQDRRGSGPGESGCSRGPREAALARAAWPGHREPPGEGGRQGERPVAGLGLQGRE